MNLKGGTEIAAVKLVEALKKKNVEAEILSIEHYKGEKEYVRSLGYEFQDKYMKYSNNFINKILFPRRVHRLLKDRLEEYVRENNVQTFINFTYDLFPASPSNVNSIGVIHWSIKGYEQSIRDIANRKNVFASWISKHIANRTYREVHRSLETINHIVTLTHAGADEVHQLNGGVGPDRISVIPNFIRDDDRQMAFSNQKNKRIAFVSRLSVEKGCYRLLQIWEKVGKELPDWSLDIYGTGQEENNMKRYVSEHDVRNLHFHGFIEDMSQYYPKADILLCTSDSEGFGMVLIEAMSQGVIPVSFDCPVSPKELIADGGRCVECFDLDKFAETVKWLCRNYESRLEIQQKAIRRSLDFREDKVVDLWQAII